MKKLTKPQAEQLVTSLQSWRRGEEAFDHSFEPHEEELLDAFEKALADLPNAIHEPVQVAANFLYFLPYTQPENKFNYSTSKFQSFSKDFNVWRRALESCGLEFDYDPDGYPSRTVTKNALAWKVKEILSERRGQFIYWLEVYADEILAEPTVEIKPLAEYGQHSPDGEAGVLTIIFPKWTEDGHLVSKKQALELSGLEYDGDERMGSIQKDSPTVTGTKCSWVIEQTWRANV